MITPIQKRDYTDKNRDPLTERIIGCCYKVHSELGPGLNEKIYQRALLMALKEDGLDAVTEKTFKVYFQNKNIGTLRVDLIIDGKVIVEIKSLPRYMPEVFKHQLLSYLRISGIKVGLLINFGNPSCRVKRFSL